MNAITTGRVLVIADGQASLNDAVRILTDKGYKVLRAREGDQAVGLSRQQRFDLLLAEATEDGVQAAHTLRRADPNMAVVLVGDHEAISTALRSLNSGIQSYLTQPFTKDELEWTVADVLKRCEVCRDSRRLKALLPLFEMTKSLMSEVDLEKLFNAIVETVWAETEADSVALLLSDADKEVVVRLGLGLPQNRGRGANIASSVAGTEPNLTEASSVVCFPLVVRGREVGVLHADRNDGATPFAKSDLDLFSLLCSPAAIALEKLHIVEDIKSQRERVQQAEQMLARTVQLQEEERKHISLDIHDSVLQWMAAALYRLQACEDAVLNHSTEADHELLEIKRLIVQSIKELRRLLSSLRTPPLDKEYLLDSLRQTIEFLRREQHTRVGFEINGEPFELPPPLLNTAVRVAQEALTNVRKHAAATKVEVRLCFKPDQVVLEICDNGKGFDPEQAKAKGQLGLIGMRERAEALAGELAIESAVGLGTRIVLVLPASATSADLFSTKTM